MVGWIKIKVSVMLIKYPLELNNFSFFFFILFCALSWLVFGVRRLQYYFSLSRSFVWRTNFLPHERQRKKLLCISFFSSFSSFFFLSSLLHRLTVRKAIQSDTGNYTCVPTIAKSSSVWVQVISGKDIMMASCLSFHIAL